MIDSKGFYISLAEVGGLSFYPFPVTGVAVKAFYDASGNPRAGTDPCFVLAGYAASKLTFMEIEKRWRETVTGQYGATYLHMREAAVLRGEFSRTKGWDEDKVNRLVYEAAGLIKEFGVNLWAVAYGINLKEWKRRRKHQGKETSYRAVHRECAAFCLGKIINGLHGNIDNDVGKLEVYHSQGDENLFADFRRLWVRADTKEKHEWARRVVSVLPLDMRITPGLQMADLLAWATRRTLHQNDIGGLFPFLTGIGNRVFTNIRRE